MDDLKTLLDIDDDIALLKKEYYTIHRLVENILRY